MDQKWTQALKASISDVFLTMFFLVPEEDAAILAAQGGLSLEGWLEGSLTVNRQDRQMRISVLTPPDVARELAANIFACDEDEVEPGQILDAFKEMMNMVAGGVLTAVDSEASWKMGLPMAAWLPGGTLADNAQHLGSSFAYDLEGRPMLAGITQS